jgi:hypothetical protein
MKSLVSAAILIGLFCVSCGSGSNNAKQRKQSIGDTANYYPVADFFRQQIEYVDLRDFPIYQLRTIDGKKDSFVLSKDAFISMAKAFIQKGLTEPGRKAAYQETVFEDLSTDSYTLNYTSTDPSLEVHSIDVLLSPETRIVKRVFIKGIYHRGDTTIDEQLSWKADKSFQLIRNKQTTNGYHSVETNYINWNDQH